MNHGNHARGKRVARLCPAFYDTRWSAIVSNATRESVVLSWSGGKDSSLALAALRADPRYDVVALLTSVTRGYDRISIHGASHPAPLTGRRARTTVDRSRARAAVLERQLRSRI